MGVAGCGGGQHPPNQRMGLVPSEEECKEGMTHQKGEYAGKGDERVHAGESADRWGRGGEKVGAI